MKTYPLTLVLGGAASGKSEWAESLVHELGSRVWYLATALPGRAAARSPIWREKISRHRIRRPKSWRTFVLADHRLPAFPPERPHAILLDSLTLWVSARISRSAAPSAGVSDPGRIGRSNGNHLREDLASLLAHLRSLAPLVIVSDEVGMGLTPITAVGRRFIEVLGRINAATAAAADEVFWIVSGTPVQLKSSPHRRRLPARGLSVSPTSR